MRLKFRALGCEDLKDLKTKQGRGDREGLDVQRLLLEAIRSRAEAAF